MKFLTFIEIDLRKVIPLLVGMFILATLAFQGLFAKLVIMANDELIRNATQTGVTVAELVKSANPLSLTTIIDSNPYPLLALLFVGMGLILFGFYVWYKEWFGASKRIYTLLSIKGSRFRIFTSKLIVFLFIFLAYYAVILLNLFISTVVMKLILPEQAISDHLVANFMLHSQFLPYVLPVSVRALLFNLAFIMMMFAILSVFVLSDRSQRIWGMLFGFVYMISTIVIFFYVNTLELYTSERLMANWAFTGIVLIISTLISYYLLKKKVSI